jgi:hypothetical protein
MKMVAGPARAGRSHVSGVRADGERQGGGSANVLAETPVAMLKPPTGEVIGARACLRLGEPAETNDGWQ